MGAFYLGQEKTVDFRFSSALKATKYTSHRDEGVGPCIQGVKGSGFTFPESKREGGQMWM